MGHLDSQLDEVVEGWWRDHQLWLESCGYMIRPRYRVGWQGAATQEEKLWNISWIMDATRISDGAAVALKRARMNTQEEPMMRLLNSEPLASHPDNPCVPLYDVLKPIPEDEEHEIFVIPFLRAIESPPFETVGEVMEFCRQAIHGLRFLHEHNIAHRSLSSPHTGNIMLDPRNMYPDGFYTGSFLYDHRKRDFTGRAKQFTRTQRPSRYYWIDYGLTGMFHHPEKPGTLQVPYVIGGDKNIPETKKNQLYADPFASDVWWVGNVIRKRVLRYTALDFLTPLLDEMFRENPEDRPTMAAAPAQFDEILAKSSWRLRRLTVQKKNHFCRLLQAFPAYVVHTLVYLVMRMPALPRPPEATKV
ncbi:hypothetical protein C8R45DRAFT_1190870 [Mycena sanguinolenta]|nr:hypothetical protein C8R45DRAFT_1190870 [Mycena sanguinolenta]